MVGRGQAILVGDPGLVCVSRRGRAISGDTDPKVGGVGGAGKKESAVSFHPGSHTRKGMQQMEIV